MTCSPHDKALRNVELAALGVADLKTKVGISMKSSQQNRSTCVPNVEFWDSAAVVQTQQADPYLHWYERHLIDSAAQILASKSVHVRLIHGVGCGPGRELPLVRQAFPDARIIASDIAPKMIDACIMNLEKWGCNSGVELKCCPASLLVADAEAADLVIALNNMLTYVTPKSERHKTFHAFRSILRPGGLLIGTVHHRWGKPVKSGYFLLQLIAHATRLSSQELGDHIGGFAGLSTLRHYYTAGELRALLSTTGFVPLMTLSLASLARQVGRKHNPIFGDNNLVFVGEAH